MSLSKEEIAEGWKNLARSMDDPEVTSERKIIIEALKELSDIELAELVEAGGPQDRLSYFASCVDSLSVETRVRIRDEIDPISLNAHIIMVTGELRQAAKNEQ